jgi:hypothetical protein
VNALLMEQNGLSADKASIAKGQPLNPLDSALCCVDRSIRGMGYPGFETQMLVCYRQVDAGRLRQVIERCRGADQVSSG